MLSRRLLVVPALAALALSNAPASAAPRPQLVDVPGDANGGATVPHILLAAPETANQSTPPANQGYADVLSVLWQTTKTTKKVGKKTVTTVTGFTVTATLAAEPKPPAGTSLVYRMLGQTKRCTPTDDVPSQWFGVAYYTDKPSDPTQPQSAIRDLCNGKTGNSRLTPIPMPVVSGTTIKWTVPLKAIPADLGIKAGDKITNLWFQVAEIEDWHKTGAPCVPKEPIPAPPTVPVLDVTPADYRGSCGLGAGIIDDSPDESAASYIIK